MILPTPEELGMGTDQTFLNLNMKGRTVATVADATPVTDRNLPVLLGQVCTIDIQLAGATTPTSRADLLAQRAIIASRL